jgi:hypothetical protein
MTPKSRLPRAVREATAFDGRVDAYQFEDGSISVSAQGAASGLTGTPGKPAALSVYTSEFIEETRSNKLPIFEFVTPRGAVAKGLMLDDFTRLVEWWAEAFFSGRLRANQEHIGLNCARMQSAAARVGWEAMARGWFGQELPAKDVPIVYAKWLRENAEKYAPFYQWELPDALARLKRLTSPVSREQWPIWMKRTHEFLYNAMLSKVADEARKRRAETGAKTLPQVFSEEAKRSVSSWMPTFVGLARGAQTMTQWKVLVLNVLNLKAPVQLALLAFGEDDDP